MIWTRFKHQAVRSDLSINPRSPLSAKEHLLIAAVVAFAQSYVMCPDAV